MICFLFNVVSMLSLNTDLLHEVRDGEVCVFMLPPSYTAGQYLVIVVIVVVPLHGQCPLLSDLS